VLNELRRLFGKLASVYERATTDDERRWVRQTADVLARQIQAGDAGAVSGFSDPRPLRRVRKRQPNLLEEEG
jgi:hypothetical protein